MRKGLILMKSMDDFPSMLNKLDDVFFASHITAKIKVDIYRTGTARINLQIIHQENDTVYYILRIQEQWGKKVTKQEYKSYDFFSVINYALSNHNWGSNIVFVLYSLTQHVADNMEEYKISSTPEHLLKFGVFKP